MKNLSSWHILKKLRPIPPVIDLNAFLYYCRPSVLKREGATYEPPAEHLLSDHGLPASSRISKMRSALPRRLQGQKLLLFRSVPLPGLRPADLSRNAPRHRVLSSSHEESALPHGISGAHLPKHLGPCQRNARLAHLCRLRPDYDRSGSHSLCRRRPGIRTRKHGLCFRFDHHRLVSFSFPLGCFPPHQSGYQTPYPSRSARLDPLFYQDYRWKNARYEGSGRSHPRARLLLYPRPPLRRLWPPLRSSSEPGVLRHPGQVEPAMFSPLFSTGG